MDERIQAERPMPRIDLDLGEPQQPTTWKPAPDRQQKPRWPWIVGGIVLFLFVVFVWPTLYRWESTGNKLLRINRFTGTATVYGSDVPLLQP